jgi:hypothetical protein
MMSPSVSEHSGGFSGGALGGGTLSAIFGYFNMLVYVAYD